MKLWQGWFAFFALIGSVIGGIGDNSVSDDFPIISLTYSTEGTLYIPYAEIEEPFAAWVDFKNGRSRIDFYGGVTKTFQLSNINGYGVMRKIVPMTNEKVLNKITCFEVNGTAGNIIKPQTVLPDTSQFKYVGDEVLNTITCKKYQLVETQGQKINKYTYWVKVEPSSLDPQYEVGTPIKYEMRGYNTLLGSHYDHYYLEYNLYSPEQPSDDVFSVPQKLKCGDFPGPGVSHHKTIATFNPIKEFIHNEDRHVSTNFADFIKGHNKKYDHEKEHHHRLNVFRHNFRFVESKNRQGLSYRLAINHLADRTLDEMKVLRGRLTSVGSNGAQPFPKYGDKELKGLPDTFDWRLFGAVTPVKGSIEGAHFLKTGQLVRLSPQALVDCSWGYGNNGCDGGEDFRSYQWIMKHGGLPSEDAYGPYLGIDGYCHIENVTLTAKITGYVNVTSGDGDALKLAIVKNGPISVGIDASHRSLSFYANGVYYDPSCKNGQDDLDHAVLAVGYGTINGEDYWLVKNSWSNFWGNDGYVLMSQKDNNCGVTTSPTYVTM